MGRTGYWASIGVMTMLSFGCRTFPSAVHQSEVQANGGQGGEIASERWGGLSRGRSASSESSIRARLQNDVDVGDDLLLYGMMGGNPVLVSYFRDSSEGSAPTRFLSVGKESGTPLVTFQFDADGSGGSFGAFVKSHIDSIFWIDITGKTLRVRAEKERPGNPFGFEMATAACAGKDWATADIRRVPVGNYAPSPLIPKVIAGADTIAAAENWILPSSGADNANERYDALMTKLRARADRIPANDPMRDMKLACMATCVSSRLIVYRLGGRSNPFTGRWDNAVVGQADCKGFSSLANIVGEHLGVTMRITGSVPQQHAFSAAWNRSERKWYYLEPQAYDCQLYDPAL